MSTPAGWYDDGSGRQRWWDGQQWTEHFAPEASSTADASTPDGAAPDARASDSGASDSGASDSGIPDFDPDAAFVHEDTSAPAQAEQPTEVYPPSDVAATGYAPPAAPGYADVNATATYPGAYQAPGIAQPYGAYQRPDEPAGPKKTPVLGFVGLGLAIVGTILACIPIPLTFIFGAVVLFAAFVVSLIAIFQKNTKKWPSITGLVLSIVGGIVGTIIFTVAALTLWNSSSSVGGSAEGRPSAEEVAAGLDEIITLTGSTNELSDEQLACYGEYFVASDIPDETLWVIASGEETLSNGRAISEFSEKLATGMSTCLAP